MGLPLHPKKGANPHMTMCHNCGEPLNQIILIGAKDSKFTCNVCDSTSYGSNKCLNPKCSELSPGKMEKILDGELIPAGLCDACKEQDKRFAKVVAEGGVYWSCSSCHGSGVIGNGDFTKDLREKANIPAPNPLGIEFDNKNCPACGPKSAKKKDSDKS